MNLPCKAGVKLETKRLITMHPIKNKGFTLIELIVVIVIVSIIVSFAIPSFIQVKINNTLSSGITNFSNGLLIARSEAVKRNNRVSVCKTTDPTNATPTCSATNTVFWNQGWIAFTDSNGDGAITVADGDTVLKVGNPLENNYVLKGQTDVSNFVTYTSTGEVSKPGIFVLCKDANTKYAKQLSIGLSGRIAVADKSTTIASCNP